MDRQKREAAILDYLRPRDGWITSVEMAKALGVPKGTLTGTLGRLVKAGMLVSRMPAKGGGYRTPATGGVVASTPKTAPASPPAPAPASPPPEHPANVAPAPELLRPQAGLAPFAGDLDYFNGLRRDWYDGKAEMDVDQLFAFATRMRDELLGKLTSIKQCHVYRLPVVAGDLSTGEVGVHWIDGLDQSEVSAVIHDSEAPGVYESVDWKADPPGNEPRMPVPFAGIDYELVVIGTIVRQIESLTGHETRVRVAAYVASRFLP